MRTILTLFILIFSNDVYSQSNSKVDSLNNEIAILQSRIKLLESEIKKEISSNGYTIQVNKKYSFSQLLVRKEKYGEVIDTLFNGDEIKVLAKDYTHFKIRTKDNLVGFIEIYNLKIEDSNSPINQFIKLGNTQSSSGTSSNKSSSKKKRSSSIQRKKTTSRTYFRGPRGGCYYYNSSGNKQYVSRSFCN